MYRRTSARRKALTCVPVVDILVNNPGIFEPKPFSEITDEDWLRFFEVNVLSGARLSRFYLPQMLQKNWGRILFISSESGVNIPVEMVHYGVTKTAQIALARLALPWSCGRRCARRKRQRAASIARPHDASAADISTRAEIAAAWPPALELAGLRTSASTPVVPAEGPVPTARHECRDVDRLPAGGALVSLMDDCRTYYHGNIEYRLGPALRPGLPDDEDGSRRIIGRSGSSHGTPRTPCRREKYAEP